MRRKTFIAVMAITGVTMIAAGVALNAYFLFSAPQDASGAQSAQITFDALVLESEHPGFGPIIVGVLLLAASFGATFVSGRYKISN